MNGTTVNAATDYGDLLQHEWPQTRGDSAFTHFSAGSAPRSTRHSVENTHRRHTELYCSLQRHGVRHSEDRCYCPPQGHRSHVWNTTLPALQRWPAVYKIDETHLVIGNKCLDLETGEVLWVSDKFSAKAAYFAEGVYSSEEKSFLHSW